VQYCDSDPAYTELLTHMSDLSPVDVDQSRHPCIVIEGLDAAGIV